MNKNMPTEQHMPVPHPDFEALREEEKRLRAELTALLLQKDELESVQLPRIEASYLRRFGALELKLYEAYCDCLRAKRKASMIRASVNRRETVDLRSVDASLDRELSSYRDALQEKMELMDRVLNPAGAGPRLSAAGREELKKLYRGAIRTLHPDLHPDATEREQRLLQKAIDAYKFGDLTAMRRVCEAADALERPEEKTGLEALQLEVRRLRKSIRGLISELDERKKAYPFNLRAFLEDPKQADSRRAALEEKLRGLQARKQAYEERIREMLNPEETE